MAAQPSVCPGGRPAPGPGPASVAKINNRYRYRLTLACKNTRQAREMVAYLLRCAQADRTNKGVSISADVNPLD